MQLRRFLSSATTGGRPFRGAKKPSIAYTKPAASSAGGFNNGNSSSRDDPPTIYTGRGRNLLGSRSDRSSIEQSFYDIKAVGSWKQVREEKVEKLTAKAKQMQQQQHRKPDRSEHLRVNEGITGVTTVLMAFKDTSLGSSKTCSFEEALQIAKDLKLDLVEVNPRASPPVCRVESFAAFIEEKKAHRAQRTAVMGTQPSDKTPLSTKPVKEVTLGTNISPFDLDFKINNVKGFLDKFHPVKVTVTFKHSMFTAKDQRSRLAQELLTKISEGVAQHCAPSKNLSKDIGKGLVHFFHPKSQAQVKQQQEQLAKQQEKAAEVKQDEAEAKPKADDAATPEATTGSTATASANV